MLPNKLKNQRRRLDKNYKRQCARLRLSCMLPLSRAGAIPLHFQMPSFCLNGVSAEEQKVKQKWAFSTFHTAERRQHRPPLRGGQCAKAQSEWRQVSARRRQAHWRQAQWWHEQLRGRRTSHQYGSNAAGMREAAAEAVAAAAGLRVE